MSHPADVPRCEMTAAIRRRRLADFLRHVEDTHDALARGDLFAKLALELADEARREWGLARAGADAAEGVARWIDASGGEP